MADNTNWTFLTNHAHVLLCLAGSSSMRMRDIADTVGITERAVNHIIADLVKAGYIDRVKDGRCNVYRVHYDKNLRHPVEKHRRIKGLISFIQRDLEKTETITIEEECSNE
ncbi:MAG: MarR family transcriptional regulator [Oligoflexia bacterium]|nr:MarR family transcriptional regulator [Oligoflexia bacterium]